MLLVAFLFSYRIRLVPSATAQTGNASRVHTLQCTKPPCLCVHKPPPSQHTSNANTPTPTHLPLALSVTHHLPNTAPTPFADHDRHCLHKVDTTALDCRHVLGLGEAFSHSAGALTGRALFFVALSLTVAKLEAGGGREGEGQGEEGKGMCRQGAEGAVATR